MKEPSVLKDHRAWHTSLPTLNWRLWVVRWVCGYLLLSPHSALRQGEVPICLPLSPIQYFNMFGFLKSSYFTPTFDGELWIQCQNTAIFHLRSLPLPLNNHTPPSFLCNISPWCITHKHIQSILNLVSYSSTPMPQRTSLSFFLIQPWSLSWECKNPCLFFFLVCFGFLVVVLVLLFCFVF